MKALTESRVEILAKIRGANHNAIQILKRFQK